MAHYKLFSKISISVFLLLSLHNNLNAAVYMKLKYQKEIDALKLSIVCPNGLSALPNDENVFRYCRNPIDLENDFLPNVIYDRIMGITVCDYSPANNDEPRKCGRCAASFHKKIESLLQSWNNMSIENKGKFGYTAISKGTIGSSDGLAKVGKSGHIGLYEFDGASYHSSFEIFKELA